MSIVVHNQPPPTQAQAPPSAPPFRFGFAYVTTQTVFTRQPSKSAPKSSSKSSQALTTKRATSTRPVIEPVDGDTPLGTSSDQLGPPTHKRHKKHHHHHNTNGDGLDDDEEGSEAGDTTDEGPKDGEPAVDEDAATALDGQDGAVDEDAGEAPVLSQEEAENVACFGPRDPVADKYCFFCHGLSGTRITEADARVATMLAIIPDGLQRARSKREICMSIYHYYNKNILEPARPYMPAPGEAVADSGTAVTQFTRDVIQPWSPWAVWHHFFENPDDPDVNLSDLSLSNRRMHALLTSKIYVAKKEHRLPNGTASARHIKDIDKDLFNMYDKTMAKGIVIQRLLMEQEWYHVTRPADAGSGGAAGPSGHAKGKQGGGGGAAGSKRTVSKSSMSEVIATGAGSAQPSACLPALAFFC